MRLECRFENRVTNILRNTPYAIVHSNCRLAFLVVFFKHASLLNKTCLSFTLKLYENVHGKFLFMVPICHIFKLLWLVKLSELDPKLRNYILLKITRLVQPRWMVASS
jgi:hypothetical protein